MADETLYQSLKDRLVSQHEAITFILKDTTSELLQRQPAPGKWSIRDQLAHLARYQPVFLERISRILVESEPQFERYRAEDDARFPEWQKMQVAELLQRLASDRTQIVKRIVSLNSGELQKTGIHPKFGKLTVIQWLEFFVLHEAHHIFAIWQLKNGK